jgi:hypothetical protein
MAKWLLVGLLGVVLLTPGMLYWAWIWFSDPVRPADIRAAFQRLATVPFSQAASDRGVEVAARIPDDASWRRVIRNWGDPGYFIGAVSPGSRHYIYCLKDLAVRVKARIGDQPLSLEPADAPYGYSFNCSPAGLLFRAPPGAVVQIRIDAAGLPREPIDLVVERYWTGGTKDRLVGVYIQEDLHVRFLATVLGIAGIVVISVAAWLFSHRPLQPRGVIPFA